MWWLRFPGPPIHSGVQGGWEGKGCRAWHVPLKEGGSVLPALTWDSLGFVSCSEKGSYEGAGVPSVQRFFKAWLCQEQLVVATRPPALAGGVSALSWGGRWC